MVQPTNSVRSATADEGIRLLKQGVAVTKYGRTGQPHKEKLLLSADERSLGWAGHIASKLMSSSKLLSPKALVSSARSVPLSEIVELCVGHETSVFQRHVRQAISTGKPVAAGPHLSFSLVLKSTLPSPPAASDDADAEGGGAQSERETLDVSCEDDEQFGLCVAALRALLEELAKTARLSMDAQHAQARGEVRARVGVRVRIRVRLEGRLGLGLGSPRKRTRKPSMRRLEERLGLGLGLGLGSRGG